MNLLKPSLNAGIVALIIAIAIPLLDYMFSYSTEDMHFNGIHRITGDKYYFLGANVMKYAILALGSYAVFNLVFYALSKSKKQKVI